MMALNKKIIKAILKLMSIFKSNRNYSRKGLLQSVFFFIIRNTLLTKINISTSNSYKEKNHMKKLLV